MRKVLRATLGIVGLFSAASQAEAGVTIDFGGSTPVPSNDDFAVNLNGSGLVTLASTGATITLDQSAQILFEFLGSESAYDDTFSTGGLTPVSYTETSQPPGESHFLAPIIIGVDTFMAGSLGGLLNFTSSLGTAASVGDPGFGIFLPRNRTSPFSTNVFYLGYDDQTSGPDDDDFDDFVIRATVLPEPATWAMMLLGFGTIGLAFRRQRNPAAACSGAV